MTRYPPIDDPEKVERIAEEQHRERLKNGTPLACYTCLDFYAGVHRGENPGRFLQLDPPKGTSHGICPRCYRERLGPIFADMQATQAREAAGEVIDPAEASELGRRYLAAFHGSDTETLEKARQRLASGESLPFDWLASDVAGQPEAIAARAAQTVPVAESEETE